ncbi:hypothetical protein RJ639_041788 [Escallonia herrerae]|uniref:Uncharacterized protein n=1 Tax=Escallonia herrerae TaxID=1293975 RepID=A0AA89BBB1_9ASTE|nr:hypothetical protein RJ639_041788 [Escallonia herrerae]
MASLRLFTRRLLSSVRAHGFNPSMKKKSLSTADMSLMSNIKAENAWQYSRTDPVCLHSSNAFLALNATPSLYLHCAVHGVPLDLEVPETSPPIPCSQHIGYYQWLQDSLPTRQGERRIASGCLEHPGTAIGRAGAVLDGRMGARLDELVRAHGRLLEGRGGAELDGRGGAVLGGCKGQPVTPGHARVVSNTSIKQEKKLRPTKGYQEQEVIIKIFFLYVTRRKGLSGEETLKLGSYNALLKSNLPEEFKYYKSDEESFESSHDAFRSAFPRDVHSGPLVIAYEFRHWGYFEGPFKGHAPTGEMAEFYGMGIRKVDELLRAEDVGIYYDPAELFAGLY